MGIDRKSYTRAHRAPQRGHGALLEPLAQLGDALSGVLALKISVEAAELVIVQTARCGVAVSMGADTKANTRELVRSPGGLLERLQRRVTLEALRESSSSFGTEVVLSQTASTGTEMGAEWCLSGVNGR